MVFNGDANNQDICSLADKLVKTDDIDFPLDEKALYANWGMREIWKAIWLAYGGWITEDANQTTLPEAIGNLTLLQFYTLPPDIQELVDVEVMDSSLSWRKLNVITIEDIIARGWAESEFMKTPGNPQYYRPVANGFKLYPASDTARNSAIRVVGPRDIVVFTPTTTNVSPGFDSTFHESLALFMALQYSKINSMAVAGGVMRGGFKTGLLADWSSAIDDISDHYQTKCKQLFPPAVKHTKAFANQYVS